MKILWCEEHNASGWGGGRARFCHLRPFDDERDSGNYSCRMVPMRLIPEDAWSGKLVKRISEAIKTTIWKVPTGTDHEEAAFAAAVAALEAIDAFALDGETP